ncbi:hypothetical protein CJF30_00002866 [Rutstroemia sp. NJR-2017a BBW]|nr:hypothetical protein CJF30_00002866 [Rutstroemia sp. NJR-2017a BBW]
MQFLTLLSLVAGLAASADAVSPKPHIAPRVHAQKQYLAPASVARLEAAQPASSQFKDLIIQGIVTRSAVDSANRTVYDDSISFTFIDPNSNSSTACNDDFQGTAETTSFPTGWVPCNNNLKLMDDFYWQFTSYTSLTLFTIELMHGYVSAGLPSSNQAVIVRSENKTISLTCADVNHVDGCYSNQTIPVKITSAVA